MHQSLCAETSTLRDPVLEEGVIRAPAVVIQKSERLEAPLLLQHNDGLRCRHVAAMQCTLAARQTREPSGLSWVVGRKPMLNYMSHYCMFSINQLG